MFCFCLPEQAEHRLVKNRVISLLCTCSEGFHTAKTQQTQPSEPAVLCWHCLNSAEDTELTLALTLGMLPNPCERPAQCHRHPGRLPVPGDTSAGVWGSKKGRCGGGHGQCELAGRCRAQPSPQRSFSITGNTWPPFLSPR